MLTKGIRLILTLALSCAGAQALWQEQKMTVTGALTHIMAIGGESTGWQIQLNSDVRIDGKPVDTVEIDFRDSKILEKLQNKRVKATGKLSRRTGVETGVRSVLVVSSIEEVAAPPPSPSHDLTSLFSRIWQATNAPSKPARGSIYIFMPNGTLLQTSCTETYRIARWSPDKDGDFSVLRVVEDGQIAFTASIIELTGQTLKLQQKLARGNEARSLTLKAVEREFVCPDLPK